MIIKLIHTFNRFDVNSEKTEETFSGDNSQEVFKNIYKYRKTFRYCNDGFKFLNKQDEIDYNNWYNYHTLLNLIKVKTFGDCKGKKVTIQVKHITLTMIVFHHRGK